MKLRPEEPPAVNWRVELIDAFMRRLIEMAGPSGGGPLIVGIDGRSSSGKTTLARRISEAADGVAVVHTDDIAWHYSVFGWTDIMIEGVIEPVRRGKHVTYRPPTWDARDRPGAVDVPAGARIVIIEGVGAIRRELSALLGAKIWVQSDADEIGRRDAGRLASGEVSREVFESWMAEEIPFLVEQRPWEIADVIVAGTPELQHDPETEVVVGRLA